MLNSRLRRIKRRLSKITAHPETRQALRMVRDGLRRIQFRLGAMTRDPRGSLRGWVKTAFRDFVFEDGHREELLTSLTYHAHRILTAFKERDSSSAARHNLAQILLDAGKWMNAHGLWHKDLKFKSYVDVAIEVRVLRVFVDHLNELSNSQERTELTALVLESFPDSRVALLAHAELLLEQGEVDAAIESVQRALRVQAVCTTAQKLLFRAFQAKRETGSEADELRVLDYDLGDKFCHVPFTHLSTGWKGSAFACACPAWVPFPVENVFTAESPDAVWNSEVTQEIRRSILDGDFSYCSRTLCSFIAAEKLPRKSDIEEPVLRRFIDNRLTRLDEPPRMVELNYDTTCNLACPSCRTEIVIARDYEQDAFSRASERVVLPLLKTVKGQSYLSGGGEAFASKHYRSILSRLNRDEYPGLGLHLITNALLITPRRWSEFPNLPEMVDLLSVSVDAARAETYEKLRRPGKWSVLMTNLEFIAGMRRSGEIRSLGLNFVVQKDNFQEILEFVELGNRLGADKLWLQKVTNYGAYDEATFAEVNVTSPAHRDHAQLLKILRNPLLQDPRVEMSMLMSLLPEIVDSQQRIETLYRVGWPSLP